MRFLLLPVLLVLPACSPQAAETTPTPSARQASVHPVSGLEVVPLRIVSLGKTHDFRVEVARTPQQQSQGLMFRTAMGLDEGMLFPYDQPHVLSFWMKNTVLSLDLVFIGPDRRIINIAANTVPYSLTPVGAVGMSSAVLEIPGGRAAALGIGQGAKVDW